MEITPPHLPKENEHPLKLLFVGTYFWANIPGLKSFIRDVMPAISGIAELYVVGKGMERLGQDYPDEDGIHFVGEVSVPELKEFYLRSHVFVAPITVGGGMKTKVAEAMMYGLPIVGTKEAFMGYDIEPDRIGCCSDDMSAYIKFFKNLTPERLKCLSIQSRKEFENNYSLESSVFILNQHYNTAYDK